MPLYYFHLCDGTDTVLDPEGAEVTRCFGKLEFGYEALIRAVPASSDPKHRDGAKRAMTSPQHLPTCDEEAVRPVLEAEPLQLRQQGHRSHRREDGADRQPTR